MARLRSVLLAALAASASALGQWELSVAVSGAQVAPGNFALPPSSARDAVSHVFNHVLGIASPVSRDAADPMSTKSLGAPLAGLPVTEMFARPSAGLFVSVAGGGEGLLAGATSPADGLVSVHLEADHLGHTLSKVAVRRDDVLPGSFEVVGHYAAAHAMDNSAALRWDHRLGFVAAKGAPASNVLPEDMLGVVACSKAGQRVLTTKLGFTVDVVAAAARGVEHACPVYLAPRTGSVARPTLLDPALDASAAHALSEAALLLLASEHHLEAAAKAAALIAEADAAAKEEHRATLGNSGRDYEVGGIILHRFFFTGPASVAHRQAKAGGVESDAYKAVRAALASALSQASAALTAAYPPGRFATVVFSSTFDAALWDSMHAQYAQMKHGHGAEEEAGGALDGFSGTGMAAHGHGKVVTGHHHGRMLQSNGTTPAAIIAATAAVADYQVILWTAIGLVAALAAVLCVMLGMDSEKDPALFAQVMDASAGSKKMN